MLPVCFVKSCLWHKTHIVDSLLTFLTHSICDDHQPYLLDLFLCSNPDSCTVVTFNAAKTKLLSIAIDALVHVEMNGIELPEETSLRLLGLTFTRSVDWKPYIQSITKLLQGNWAPFIGSSISLLLNPSFFGTNLPFSHVWSTVPISGFGASWSHGMGLIF